jgi:hypothetical protein
MESMRLALAAVAFLLATTLASPALALDCTPFQTFDCANPSYYGTINGQPGEVLCGMDFTGWTLHVIEVTVTTAGVYAVSATGGTGQFGVFLEAAILQMDDCGAGTCLDSAMVTTGAAQLTLCLDAGAYTFVAAVHGTAPTDIISTGMQCITCADALQGGFSCSYCDPIGANNPNWSSLKGRFQE